MKLNIENKDTKLQLELSTEELHIVKDLAESVLKNPGAISEILGGYASALKTVISINKEVR